MTVSELHRRAMDVAERALVARRIGRAGEAKALFREAFEAEREAALRVAEDPAAPEPTRSVLLRSAATLALDCGQRREAQRLAARGLAGDPSPEIADELAALLALPVKPRRASPKRSRSSADSPRSSTPHGSPARAAGPAPRRGYE